MTNTLVFVEDFEDRKQAEDVLKALQDIATEHAPMRSCLAPPVGAFLSLDDTCLAFNRIEYYATYPHFQDNDPTSWIQGFIEGFYFNYK